MTLTELTESFQQPCHHGRCFLPRRERLVQLLLRLCEGGFFLFPRFAEFGELRFQLLGRRFVIDRLLQRLCFRTRRPTATIAICVRIALVSIATTAAAAP